MKKILAVISIILLFATAAVAADWAKGSGARAASAAISTKSGVLCQVIISSASTNAVTLDLYDNPSAGSGTKLIPTWIVPAQATVGGIYTLNIADERFGSGLYAAVTSSGGFSYVVIYREDK